MGVLDDNCVLVGLGTTGAGLNINVASNAITIKIPIRAGIIIFPGLKAE
jgi:hypothetical protein